jgi:hypothetical protein
MGSAQGVRHIMLGGGENLLCLWPRHGLLRIWGSELLTAYMESPCGYRHPQEAARDHTGIWKRGCLRLRRSVDGGETWADAGKAFDNSLPYDRQRQVLHLDEYRRCDGPAMEQLDMRVPEAVFLMGRAWCGDDLPALRVRAPVLYCLRSTDKGGSWSAIPSVLWPAHSGYLTGFANNVLRTSGGDLLASVAGQNTIEKSCAAAGCGPQLYGSLDEGATWTFRGEIWNDPAGRVAGSHPRIVQLASGRWLCFMECRHAEGDARTPCTAVCLSEDEGLNWSAARTIAAWTDGPFPLRLRDGRLIVIFMRTAPDPTGLFFIVSEDDGLHWSRPICLRDDALRTGPRGIIGGAYPVAEQLDDGRVFAVYGWEHDDEDVPWYGGRNFIAGTFFDVR